MSCPFNRSFKVRKCLFIRIICNNMVRIYSEPSSPFSNNILFSYNETDFHEKYGKDINKETRCKIW